MTCVAIFSQSQSANLMNYYLIEPVADAEMGKDAVISWANPRKIVFLHVSLFSYPESDLILASPAFLATRRLRTAMESAGISGVAFLPCQASKDPQYDDHSETMEVPEIFGLEPIGVDGVDDIVFHDDTMFKGSKRFVDILKSLSCIGCVFIEC